MITNPKKKKVFLISNMYPSKKNVRYGIFVKNFETAIQEDFLVKKLVITKKYRIVNKLIAYLVLYFRILFLLFRAKKNDLIYIHFPLHVAPMILLLMLANKKIILNFHGSDLIFNTVLTKILSFFLVPILKKSQIVVPSVFFKEKLRTKYNVSGIRIFVYPSGGINRSIFFPMKKPFDNFRIGFVSNFIPGKGWNVFLEAVKKIKKKGYIGRLKIIMVGDGPDLDKINHFIKKNDIKVEFHINLTQEQLAKIYNKLDLFIFPTEKESLGLVGLEAMSCGVPVIVSDVDGPREYVRENFNGFLFDKQDIDNLVNKVFKYYGFSEADKIIMSNNCEKTALQYDSIKVKGLLLKFLKQV